MSKNVVRLWSTEADELADAIYRKCIQDCSDGGFWFDAAKATALCHASLAQLREQLAKAEAEAKRYREAWIALRSYVNSELTNWDIRNGDRWLQTQLVAMTMDDLIPPAKGEGE